MFLFLSVREPRSPIGPRSASASAWIQVTPLAQLSLLSIAFAFFLPFHPLAWVPHHLHNYHSSLPYPVLILTHRARSQFGAFKESICSALEQSSRAVEDAKISMDELADQAELIVQVIITYIVPPSCSSFLSPFSSSFLSCPLPCLALPCHCTIFYTHTHSFSLHLLPPFCFLIVLPGTGRSEESRVRSHDTATVRVLQHPAVQRQPALLPLPLHSRLLCYVPLTQGWRPAAGRHREVEVRELLHYTALMILPQLYLNIQCDVSRSIYFCIDLICSVDAFLQDCEGAGGSAPVTDTSHPTGTSYRTHTRCD